MGGGQVYAAGYLALVFRCRVVCGRRAAIAGWLAGWWPAPPSRGLLSFGFVVAGRAQQIIALAPLGRYARARA